MRHCDLFGAEWISYIPFLYPAFIQKRLTIQQRRGGGVPRYWAHTYPNRINHFLLCFLLTHHPRGTRSWVSAVKRWSSITRRYLAFPKALKWAWKSRAVWHMSGRENHQQLFFSFFVSLVFPRISSVKSNYTVHFVRQKNYYAPIIRCQ